MNARTRKEMRQLAPAWLAALLLTTLPFLRGSFPYIDIDPLSRGLSVGPFEIVVAALAWHIAPFIIGLVFMAVTSFGREFTSSSFQLFLSQPVSRRQLWREKTAILGIATLSVWLVYWTMLSGARQFHLGQGALALLVAFGIMTTGLWTTLLFRQVVPALCFSLLIPCLLYPFVGPFFGLLAGLSLPPWVGVTIVFLPLAAYGAAGFYFARWLFVRAQDLQPLRFERIRTPVDRETAVAHRPAVRRRGTTWNLTLKEIRLHEVNFYCALVLFLVLGALAVVFAAWEKEEAFEVVEISVILVLLFMPVLVGSVAIAEERKLGTLEMHNGLPVSRVRQFLVKLAVTFIAILALALVLPLIVIHVVASTADVHLLDGYLREVWEISGLVAFAVFAGSVAFFVSSLSRNTPAALLVATVTLALALLGFGWIVDRQLVDVVLAIALGVPAAAGVLLILSFSNYASSLTDFRHFARVVARAAAWCLGIMAISGAAIWLVLDVATGIKLRRAISAWDEAGISMNVREYLPPVPPREENAAMILEQVINDDFRSGEHRMSDRVRADTRDVNEIAYELLLKLETTTVSPELLRELEIAFDRSENARRLQVAREAIEYDRFSTYPDFDLGPSFNVPHISVIRHLARLLQSEAVLRAAQGRWEEAYGSLAESLQLGELLSEERFIISALSQVAVRGMTLRPLEAFLRIQPPQEEMFHRWRELLAGLDPIDVSETLVFDSVLMSQWILRQYDEGELRPSEYMDARERRESHFADTLDRRGFRPLHKAGVAAVLDVHRGRIGILRRIQQGDAEEEVLGKWEDSMEMEVPWYAPWTSEFLVAGSRVLIAGKRAQAELELARTGLAAHAYRAVENEWPGSIGDLVPSYLSEIPRDPFDHEPLRYIRDDTRVILYSIGLNRNDDGGTQVDRLDPEQPGDIVWVLEER